MGCKSVGGRLNDDTDLGLEAISLDQFHAVSSLVMLEARVTASYQQLKKCYAVLVLMM
jgi:hypothetical protein